MTHSIVVDARDFLDERDWKALRKEALDDLLNEKGPNTPHFINDLVNARAAILGRRYSEALLLIERALSEVREN